MNDYKSIQKNVEGNLKHENIKVSNIAKNINMEYLKGNITSNEAVERIKKYYLGGGEHENK